MLFNTLRSINILSAGLCLALILCTMPINASDNLPKEISQALAKSNIPTSSVSIEAINLSNSKNLLSLNPSTPRNPASVIKLLTTLAALEILGPSYTWQTRYFVDGSLKQGTLNGNLILQGGGDPFLTLDNFWLQLVGLSARGLKRIEGDLVIDTHFFDLPIVDRGAFDGQSTRLYNVGPYTALTNFSATTFTLYPTSEGVKVFSNPAMDNLLIINKLKAVRSNCVSMESGWSWSLSEHEGNQVAQFSGNYNVNCGQYSISRSIYDNKDYTFNLFKTLWHASGNEIKGQLREYQTPERAIEIAEFPSLPLSDIITSINKYSNNVMARQLLLTIGAEVHEQPGTIQKGVLGIQNWLNEVALNMPELVIENGSGLSRQTRISANSLSNLLKHAWLSQYQPEFLSSLSLAAMDGTMRKRLNDSVLEGKARIKTGLINGVRSMAGYLRGQNNQLYSVVMMIDSSRVNYSNGNVIQDALLTWLYHQP